MASNRDLNLTQMSIFARNSQKHMLNDDSVFEGGTLSPDPIAEGEVYNDHMITSIENF